MEEKDLQWASNLRNIPSNPFISFNPPKDHISSTHASVSAAPAGKSEFCLVIIFRCVSFSRNHILKWVSHWYFLAWLIQLSAAVSSNYQLPAAFSSSQQKSSSPRRSHMQLLAAIISCQQHSAIVSSSHHNPHRSHLKLSAQSSAANRGQQQSAAVTITP